MQARTFNLPAEVQNKLVYLGTEGTRWLSELPEFVRDLERDWRINVGAVLKGGSEALVAHATTTDGIDAIVKIGVPGPTGFEQEVRTLLLANGRGYVKLLQHDAERRVMLQERLGSQLSQLNWTIPDQMDAICATFQRAWIDVPTDFPLTTGAEKAHSLAELIGSAWQELGRPCSERAVERALAFADARASAYDPADSVLVHADAHSQNTLQVVGAKAADHSAFKFVDPDGVRAEPALDLAAMMRDWSKELLAGDPIALGRARCDYLAGLTGIAPEPIWQWGFMERMSTGLYLMQLGWADEGREMLKVSDAWCA
jgi:streptomycin 6-kinase